MKKVNSKFLIMCLIKISKNTFRRKIYKKVPNLIFKINGDLLSKLFAKNVFFYKENLPYESRFSNRKLLVLHKKH